MEDWKTKDILPKPNSTIKIITLNSKLYVCKVVGRLIQIDKIHITYRVYLEDINNNRIEWDSVFQWCYFDNTIENYVPSIEERLSKDEMTFYGISSELESKDFFIDDLINLLILKKEEGYQKLNLQMITKMIQNYEKL